MSATQAAPAKLEKKPVKFSNLLCKHNNVKRLSIIANKEGLKWVLG